MTWFLAASAKITGGCHQPLTEMMLPNAIDHNTRGERVFRRGQPVRKFQTATANIRWSHVVGKSRMERLAKQIEGATLHEFAGFKRFATNLNVDVGRRAFGDSEGH